MDLAAIEKKLEQIETLLSEVVQALPARTNTSEPVNLSKDNSGLISVPLFEGFQFNEPVHACYAFLCLNAGSNRSQNDLVKQYLAESNQPRTNSESDRLRNAVAYLCRSRRLPRPWLDETPWDVA